MESKRIEPELHVADSYLKIDKIKKINSTILVHYELDKQNDFNKTKNELKIVWNSVLNGCGLTANRPRLDRISNCSIRSIIATEPK
jgi:hypothetical protein